MNSRANLRTFPRILLAVGLSMGACATPSPSWGATSRPGAVRKPGAVAVQPKKTAAARPRSFHVVLDPGHGGNDLGTVFENGSRNVAEKDVTLALGLQMAAHLRSKGVRVTLTRETDINVPLGYRTALANKLKADVFISLHMNSSLTPNAPEAEGIETYILNNTTSDTSMRLAKLENTVLSPELNANDSPPEQLDVALILRDLRLDANLSESKRLACAIQNKLLEVPERMRKAGIPDAPRIIQKNRGIKQALFHVLLGAEMPSALVEAGFLSNPHDRALVLSPMGRRSMGLALVRAIEEFRDQKGTSDASLALSRCKVH